MRSARSAGDVDFESVFARIAGASDARPDAVHFAVREPVVSESARAACASASAGSAAPSAPGSAICAYRSQANSTVAFMPVHQVDVVEILLLVRCVHADEEVIVIHFVDQDVVDESAVIVEQSRIVRLADFQLRQRCWRRRSRRGCSASGPRTSISPMWLTSNRPDGRCGPHCVPREFRSTERACPSRRNRPFWPSSAGEQNLRESLSDSRQTGS